MSLFLAWGGGGLASKSSIELCGSKTRDSPRGSTRARLSGAQTGVFQTADPGPECGNMSAKDYLTPEVDHDYVNTKSPTNHQEVYDDSFLYEMGAPRSLPQS